MRLKRGEWNDDKTKQFWAYHPSGREMWVTPKRLQETKETFTIKQIIKTMSIATVRTG